MIPLERTYNQTWNLTKQSNNGVYTQKHIYTLRCCGSWAHHKFGTMFEPRINNNIMWPTQIETCSAHKKWQLLCLNCVNPMSLENHVEHTCDCKTHACQKNLKGYPTHVEFTKTKSDRHFYMKEQKLHKVFSDLVDLLNKLSTYYVFTKCPKKATIRHLFKGS